MTVFLIVPSCKLILRLLLLSKNRQRGSIRVRTLSFGLLGLGMRGLAKAFGAGRGLLRGSWDLVSRVISKATIVISTYNPN